MHAHAWSNKTPEAGHTDEREGVYDLDSLIPEEHKAWVEHVMQRYNYPYTNS